VRYGTRLGALRAAICAPAIPKRLPRIGQYRAAAPISSKVDRRMD
jgi:hypothetical protein